MKQYTELRDIFKKYVSGQLSADEARDFIEDIQSGRDKEAVERLIHDTLGDTVEEDQIRDLLLRIRPMNYIFYSSIFFL